MSKPALVFIIVTLSVLLSIVLVVGAVYYEKYRQIYKAIMVATNNPNAQVVLTPLENPVPGNPASLMIHGVYGAQQFAKRLVTTLTLPPVMQPVLLSSDAGIVIAVDSSVPSRMYILFRGTLFDYEWKHDFDFVQTQVQVGLKQGLVHKGFQKMYLSYQPYIKKTLSQLQPTEVWVAGHSLGAALSLLTAYDLAPLLASVNGKVNCFTFAPPKLGDLSFVSAFNSLTNIALVQYVNEADLVPLIPLSVMPNTWLPTNPLFYEHIQQHSMNLFHVNHKSWQNNHSLVLHMAVVDRTLPAVPPAPVLLETSTY